MIIISKYGYLKYKHLIYRCALGKYGVGKKKKEGDKITPKGTYKIVSIYYRNDRVKKIFSKLKLIKITKDMGWCNDPKNKNYNQLIRLPNKSSHEKLHRKDNIYDIIIVLNYNMHPIIKNKGSAIFIHVVRNHFQFTEGCVALKKEGLLRLISIISRKTKVKIS